VLQNKRNNEEGELVILLKKNTEGSTSVLLTANNDNVWPAAKTLLKNTIHRRKIKILKTIKETAL